MNVYYLSPHNKNGAEKWIAFAEDAEEEVQDPGSKIKRFGNGAYGITSEPRSKDVAYFDFESRAGRRGTNWDGIQLDEKVKRNDFESKDAAYFMTSLRSRGERM
jgi:hypothetical protein